MVGLAVLELCVVPAFAQSNSQANNSQNQAAPHDDKTATNPPAGSPDKTDSIAKSSSKAATAEILAELEKMRNRIAELEAQLKAQSEDSPVEAPAVATTAASAGAPTVNPVPSAPIAIAKQTADKKPAPAEPFAFADWTWLNGNSRTTESPLDTKYFTPEFRADTSYIYDFAHPSDHTLVGSSESGRRPAKSNCSNWELAVISTWEMSAED